MHAARELPSQEVGSENRRKNAKGFPEVGALPISQAPARYKITGAKVIVEQNSNRQSASDTKDLTTAPSLVTFTPQSLSFSFKDKTEDDRLYRRIRLASPP